MLLAAGGEQHRQQAGLWQSSRGLGRAKKIVHNADLFDDFLVAKCMAQTDKNVNGCDVVCSPYFASFWLHIIQVPVHTHVAIAKNSTFVPLCLLRRQYKLSSTKIRTC
jgi:hypothetical protein